MIFFVPPDSSPEVTEPHIDIAYFRKLHSDVVASLSSLCEMWEGKTSALEDNQPGPNTEEGGSHDTRAMSHDLRASIIINAKTCVFCLF